MNATEQSFSVVLFTMLCNVFCGWDPSKRVHSNESYWAVLSCGTANMLYKGVLPLESWMESQSYMTIQTKATELYFLVVRHFAVQGGSNFWVCAVES